MNWIDVANGLTSLIGEQSRAWLETLTADNDGHQLAICLYADALLQRIAKADITAVLESVDLSANDPVAEFGTQVEIWERKASRRPFYHRLRNGGTHDPCSYARILEVRSFLRYYVTPNTGATLSPREQRRRLRLYFGRSVGVPLGKVKRVWSGGRDRAWVLPGQEVDIVLSGQRDATALVNRLGLPIATADTEGPKPHIVCVRYPDDKPLHATQPTTFDADWSRGTTLYLSCKGENGWGMTHSLNGELEGFPELVHGPIEGLTDEHFGHDIGRCEPIHLDKAALLADAYRRLAEVLQDSAGQ